MQLGPDVVVAMARLARISLPDEEVSRLAQELTAILGHFEAIQAAETHAALEADRASDVLGEAAPDHVATFSDAQARLTTLTTHSREGYFVVPRIIEDAVPEDVETGSPTSDGCGAGS